MSNTQEKKIENVSIARCALFGAIGFGIGGLIGGVVPAMLWLPMGAIGGASLGLALRREVTTLALLGAAGFLAGLVVWVWIAGLAKGLGLLFAVPAMIGGAALGLALGNWRKTIGLAIAGGLGFGIGWKIIKMIVTPLDLWLGFVLMGIIGGASLGAVLGYLEKDETAPPKPASLLASDAECHLIYITFKNWGFDFIATFEEYSKEGLINNWPRFWIGSGDDENKRITFDRVGDKWKPRTIRPLH